MKTLKRILAVVAVSVLILFVGVILFMRQSLAPMDGELKLDGLSQKVTVTRDATGIPHIKAENRADAMRALGFTIASERLFQMEIQRRFIYGRLSELFGDPALPTDKLYRSLMLKRSAERMIENKKSKNEFDTQAWADMEAYFAGVNEYIKNHPLPYEFALVGFKPDPFQPLDAYVMTGYMSYSFGIATKGDPLMTEIAQKIPQELFQTLRNDMLKTPYKISSLRNHFMPGEDFFAMPVFDSSNAWLVAPSRSASGKSIFANDPHIGYSNPAVWMEAHIQTPDFQLYGHYLPMVPFAILGHSRNLAWGFTMSLMDDMDVYRESINRENKTVIFKGKPQKYLEWTETIKVKGQPDTLLTMIETPHGPLLDHATDGKDLSFKWAFHDPENDTLAAVRKMGLAKDMKSFEEALKTVTAPGLNVMYADAENIAWWTLGDIAVKKNPNSDMVLDGASGEDEYLGKLPWEKKPKLINPPEGVIVTANSRPEMLPADIRGDWQPDDRFHTITDILKEENIWSAEEFKKLQTMNFNSNNLKIRDILVATLVTAEKEKHQELITELSQWNGHSEIDSVPATLFHLWNAEIIQHHLTFLSEEEFRAFSHTPSVWTFYKRIIFDSNSKWWEKEGFAPAVTRAFTDVMSKYKNKIPEWGELHTVEYNHPLGRMRPLNYLFNAGPYPIGGGYNEITNNKHASIGSQTYVVTAGASTRRIIDMANPERSWGINPLGISGHLLSPFARNQVQMFINGEYRPQLLNEADIEAAKTHQLILNP